MFKARGFFILPCLAVLLSLAACSSGGGTTGSDSIIIPQAPSGISQAVSAAPLKVVLTWNSSPVADHYRVYRAGYSGFDPSDASLLGISPVSSYTDLSVAAGKIYYYSVTTVSSSGFEGPASPEIMVRLATVGPPASVLAVGGDAQVTVAWSPVNGASSYSLYRAFTSGGTATSASLIASSLTGTGSYIDAVSNGQTYYYAVSSSNDFGEGPLSPEIIATPMISTAGPITIQGMIRYEDKEYDRSLGLTGNASLKAVRFADIEVVDASLASLPSVANGATLADGTYSVTVPASMVGKSLYVQVISSSTVLSSPSDTQTAAVMHLDRRLYGVDSPRFTLTGNANLNLSITAANNAAGAFNILDVLTVGFEFINSVTSPQPGLALDAYWDQGNVLGTWYCIETGQDTCVPAGEGIYVLSDPAGSGDTDEFDDDVIWHEFGHFAANKLSLDHSPGGVHYLNSNDLDLQLTWSEGWGDFFPGAVKFWLNADPVRAQALSVSAGTPLSLYIDTNNQGSHVTVDIASPESSAFCYYGFNSCKYASNEVAVANILWNLMSNPTVGMQPIWDVFAGYLPSVPAAVPVTLEAFWDGLLLQRNPGAAERAAMTSIFKDRLVDYSPDAFEDDGSPAMASAYSFGVSQTLVHTLYPGNDIDFVAFPATVNVQYTITTGETGNFKNGLTSGADTVITVFDGTGAPLSSNDNGSAITYVFGVNYGFYDTQGNYVYPLNNSVNLSSRIVFTPPMTGTYYVSIRSSPDRPVTAGRYGSYTLTITSP